MSARLPELLRSEPLLFALVAFAAVNYSLYSVWEHNHFLTDFDLAIADQALWHYSNFSEPVITTLVSPTNMLGDHFSPILALLSPLFWVWEDARMLLIAQAVLLASSFVPVFLFARPRVGRLGAYLLSGGYALFWGITAGVSYQFHELAFSPLLIALCILFADRERWPAYFVSVALLLLVKENMSVLAVFLGLWLLSGRQFRYGGITIAAALAWYALALYVFVPLFNDGEAYTHWTYDHFGENAGSAIWNIVTHPWMPFEALFDESTKVKTLALLVVPFLGLFLCSRLAILCIPLVAQQMFSDYSAQWGTEFHHWLPIAPVLAMGAADGFRNIADWLARRADAKSEQDRARLKARTAIAATAVGAFVLAANLVVVARDGTAGEAFESQVLGVPLLFPLDPGFPVGGETPESPKQRAVAAVPDDATVNAAAPVLPHLSHRDGIYLLGYEAPSTDYVIYAPSAISWPRPDYALEWLRERRDRYRPVFEDGEWTVLKLENGS
jgi:uncharacterized membrane protein